jgi:hypothetical protein
MLVCITFIGKLSQRFQRARDGPIITDRIERRAERVVSFPDRICLDDSCKGNGNPKI